MLLLGKNQILNRFQWLSSGFTKVRVWLPKTYKCIYKFLINKVFVSAIKFELTTSWYSSTFVGVFYFFKATLHLYFNKKKENGKCAISKKEKRFSFLFMYFYSLTNYQHKRMGLCCIYNVSFWELVWRSFSTFKVGSAGTKFYHI